MTNYLLLLRETPSAYPEMSREELSCMIARYQDWTRTLSERQQLVSSNKLVDEDGVRLLRRVNGATSETFPVLAGIDVIGGYYVVAAEGLEQATAIALECPHLDYAANWIEVREIQNI